jgi:hypothetical protein
VTDVKNDPSEFTNLLCEKSPDSDEFSLVKIQNEFLVRSKPGLYTRDKKGVLTFSVYLSANDLDKYVEQRGQGKISFSEYVLEGLAPLASH